MKKFALVLCVLGTCGSAAAQPAATSVTLSVQSMDGMAVSSVPALTPVRLTAHVAGSAAVAGEVRFCDTTINSHCTGAAVVAVAEVQSSGNAVSVVRLATGNHTLQAKYVGTNTLASSASTESSLQVGSNSGDTMFVNVSGSQGNYTLKATAHNPHPPAPTGSIEFRDTSYSNSVIATAPITASGTSFSYAAQISDYTFPAASFLADFDKDGLPDFVGPSFSNAFISFHHNNGTNSFDHLWGAGLSPDDYYIGSVVTGDFNRDGNLDMIVVPSVTAPASDHVTIYPGNGDGTFQTGAIVSGFTNSYRPMYAGDFDGDGFLDLIGSAAGGTAVAYGNGDGTFSVPVVVGPSASLYGAGDFNGDGRADIVGTQDGEVLFGNADRTFTKSAPSDSLKTLLAKGVSVKTGDFNSDGNEDIVVVDGTFSTQSLYVIPGNGDGTFQPLVEQTISLSNSYFIATLAGFFAKDVDGDGKTDIVAGVVGARTRQDVLFGGYQLDCTFYKGNGDGSFQTGFSLGGSLGIEERTVLLAGDFDGDGAADLGLLGSGSLASLSFVNTFTATATGVSVTQPGSHLVQARYAGDAFHGELLSNTVTLTGGGTSAQLSLVSSQPEISYGQTVTLTATLANWDAAGSNTNGRTITFYKDSASVGTAALSSGIASLTLSGLEPGTYSFAASYPGDPTQGANTSSAVQVRVDKIATVVHWPDPASISYGTALSATQLNATVKTWDDQPVTGTLVYSPAAGAVLDAGPHTLTVHFTPADTAHYMEADQSVYLEVLPGAGATVSFSAPGTISPGVAADFVVHVSAQGAVPTGTVTLFENTQTYGSATLSVSGAAVISQTFASPGAHVLQVAYSGDDNYQPAISSMQVVQVQGLQPTIVWSNPAPITYNTALTAAQLNATATGDGGASLTGTFSYSPAPGTVLAPGQQTLSVVFTPADAAYSPATKSVSITVGQASTLVSLNAITASSSVGTDSTVILHAVAYSPAGLPTGNVSFYDSTTLLGTVLLDNGAASLTTSFSTAGTHPLTAVYVGDPYFRGGTSPVLTENVVAPQLRIAASPDSFTIHQGASGVSTITLTPTGGYKGTVQFNCDGLPALASCSFAPATITLTGDDAPQSTVLTVTTTGPNTAMLAQRPSGLNFAWLLGLPFAVAASLRKGGKRVAGSLGLLCLLMLLLPSVGCGTPDSVTPTGNSSVQVIAQASAAAGSGGSAQSQSITLNITIAR